MKSNFFFVIGALYIGLIITTTGLSVANKGTINNPEPYIKEIPWYFNINLLIPAIILTIILSLIENIVMIKINNRVKRKCDTKKKQ